MKPDLSTPEGRAAHRRELRGVAWPWRSAGMTMVAGGAVASLWLGRGSAHVTDSTASLGALALIGAGGVLLVAAIVKRSLHAKARMSGES
jgi:hypothetical protein